MATVTFTLKDKTENETLVFLLLRYDGKRLKYSTKEKINPAYWLQKDHRAKRTKSFIGYESFNQRISNFKERTHKVVRELVNNNVTLNNAILKKHLDIEFKRTFEKRTTLIEYITKVFPLTKYKGENRKPQSLRPYYQLAELLKQYSQHRNQLIDFNDIDMSFYSEFIDYLTYNGNDGKGYKVNSIAKHLSTLKGIMRISFKSDFHKNRIFDNSDFRTPTEQVYNIYLNESELKKIYDFDLSNNSNGLEWSRDLFIVQSYIGLRCSDLHQLKNENIKNGFLTITTTKTNQQVIIPLNPIVLKIWNKYNNRFPTPYANPVMNRHLKEIGKLAGIDDNIILSTKVKGNKTTFNKSKYELICTHTARRSFATNMYKRGIPILSIMAITGHSTEKNFLKYIKLTAFEHAQMMQTAMMETNNQKLKVV